MSEAEALDIISQAIWAAARISLPILLTAVVVGVVVGLLQAVTQLQEQTLTFVPKFAAIGLVIVLTGSWMLGELVNFTLALLRSVPQLIG